MEESTKTDFSLKGHEAVTLLAAALRIDSENTAARELLADYYWECLTEAEEREEEL